MMGFFFLFLFNAFVAIRAIPTLEDDPVPKSLKIAAAAVGEPCTVRVSTARGRTGFSGKCNTWNGCPMAMSLPTAYCGTGLCCASQSCPGTKIELFGTCMNRGNGPNGEAGKTCSPHPHWAAGGCPGDDTVQCCTEDIGGDASFNPTENEAILSQDPSASETQESQTQNGAPQNVYALTTAALDDGEFPELEE